MLKNKNTKNTFVIGFAIFAMFFGAGNLIFPPYLGLITGKQWFLSFLCFMAMDIGLSILTLLVVTKIGKGAEGVTEKLGRFPSVAILTLNAVCLGPMIAIPRTAATAYEFSIAPFFPSVKSGYFAVVFFAVVVLFCLKQSKVVDIIGTVFAPLILAALVVLIVKGIVTPLGSIDLTTSINEATKVGVNSGYQTMDVMAAMIFSASILLTLKQKNYTKTNEQFHMIAHSGIIAAIILFIVYGGLAYLGASVSSLYGADIDRVVLLISITKALLGENGMILLGFLVCAACMTPAIGLLSSAASFFEKQTNGKLSYRVLVILFAGISCIISCFGISKILALASPILNVIYPVLILLVFLGLIRKWIPSDSIYQMASLGAFAVSVLTTISQYITLPFNMSSLPFYQYGFHWITPAVIMGLLAFVISQRKVLFLQNIPKFIRM